MTSQVTGPVTAALAQHLETVETYGFAERGFQSWFVSKDANRDKVLPREQEKRDEAWETVCQSAKLLLAGVPDDIRAAGWAVAVHNDYRLDGVPHTFWLFTKGNLCIKGEGLTDADALNFVRQQIAAVNQ